MDNILDKITNISTVSRQTISLSKAVLFFYMVIASNFMTGLVSKQMKTLIENNRIAQHIVGLMAMVILITTFGNIADVKLALLYSFIAYLWFVLTTKLDIHFNLIIIALLFVAFLFEESIDIDEIKKDKVLTEEEKNKIFDRNKYYKKMIVVAIFAVTMAGTLLYNNKKQIQYGGSYDAITYLLY